MNKEIGNVAGASIMVSPEAYEEIKKQKTIYENEILSELQQRIDKAIEYINSFEEDNPDFNSDFYKDGCFKTRYSFEDIVENTTKTLRGEDDISN